VKPAKGPDSTELQRINQRLQDAYRQIDGDLELARRIQALWKPPILNEMPGNPFAVHSLMSGRVGGDFYDVFPLGEKRIGFYVADAMGHGVSACLLTTFIRQMLTAKVASARTSSPASPADVLGGLNRDLLQLQLAEQPFLSMTYGVYNQQAATLQLARAGHPFPLHLPREGDPQWLKQEGLMLGMAEADFPVQTYHLRLGDKVLFSSDGAEAACWRGGPAGVDSLQACASHHRHLPIQELISRMSRELFSMSAPSDDLTLLGLEVRE
jgi:serine phosphatase RsbU (regulator of sigma subunit)